jgi:hypothetical protein
MEVLRHLGTYRFLTRGQIEEFVLGESTLTAHSREVATWRILRRLRTRQLVTTNAQLAGDPEGMPTRIAYFLTSSGRRIFAAAEPGLPRRRLRLRGTSLLEDALMVAEISLAFRRAVRLHPGGGTLSWECGWQVAASLVGLRIFPDARLTYETERWRTHAFIEADRGSAGSRFFGRRIERYLDVYRWRPWRERLPVWPLVLTVTRTERRASELRRASEAIFRGRPEASRISRGFRFTSLDALRGNPGPLGAIWQIAGRTGRSPFIDKPVPAAAILTETSTPTVSVSTSPSRLTAEIERDRTTLLPA